MAGAERNATSCEWSVRSCTPEDFEALLPLCRELWPDKTIDEGALRSAYQRGIASGLQAYICAVRGTQVIGLGSLTTKNSLWQEGQIAHIDELVVHHEYRGRGVGRQLLEQLEAIAVERGCRRVELDSAFHRKDAHRFYEKQGFQNRAFLFSKLLSREGTRTSVEGKLSVQIDAMTPEDWPQVQAIYEEGIATGLGTFETGAPSWEEWDAARLPHCRLVARGPAVVGWAALSPVSKRACYAGVAEVGIYVAAAVQGRGIGRALLEALIESAEANGIWTLQGATIAENAGSLALQAKCGFRTVGRRERIGKLAGVWRDTVLTERRSKNVGSE